MEAQAQLFHGVTCPLCHATDVEVGQRMHLCMRCRWKKLVIVIPFFPPSSNNVYVTNWARKIHFLSKDGKLFQSRFSQEVVPNYLVEIGRLDRKTIYHRSLYFYFPRDSVLNKTFGMKDGAASRYKRMDVTNQVKLIDDCLVKAISIDDAQWFSTYEVKLCCDVLGGVPQIHIYFEVAEPSRFGL